MFLPEGAAEFAALQKARAAAKVAARGNRGGVSRGGFPAVHENGNTEGFGRRPREGFPAPNENRLDAAAGGFGGGPHGGSVAAEDNNEYEERQFVDRAPYRGGPRGGGPPRGQREFTRGGEYTGGRERQMKERRGRASHNQKGRARAKYGRGMF